MTRRTYSPEIKEQARKLRNLGYSYSRIAELVGTDPTTVRNWTDPPYAEQRREVARQWRKRGPGTTRKQIHQVFRRPELDGPLPTVPPDTRGLDARLMGDPLPGRSALDKKGLG